MIFGRWMAVGIGSLCLGAALAAGAAEEAPRVQRALRELESVRTLAAETTNATERALWQSRMVMAEKEVENARKLVVLEERERTLATQRQRTEREALVESLRTVDAEVDRYRTIIQDLDKQIRNLKSVRADRAETLKTFTEDSEDMAQSRADLEQFLRNLDVESESLSLRRDEYDLRIRLANAATRMEEHLRSTELADQPTIRNLMDKRQTYVEANKEAASFTVLARELTQRREGVAEMMGIGRERFTHLEEEIRTLDNLYQISKRPLFSRKQEDPQQTERIRQLRTMLAEARSQRKTLEERLRLGDDILASLANSLALAGQAHDLHLQFAQVLRAERDQLIERFIRRVATPAVLIAILMALQFVFSRLLLPLFRSRDSLFVARRMSTYVLVMLSIVVLAISFLEDLRAIATVLGIAGAAVVIALQDLCSAFAGWFVIIASGKIKVGDRVEIDGHRGDVIDIQLLRTTLVEVNSWLGCDEPTGRISIVPNSFIFKSQVFNYSHLHPYVWDKIELTLQFESPVLEATALMERILREETAADFEEARQGSRRMEQWYGLADAVYEPRVQLGIGHSGTQFSLFFVTHFRKVDEVRSRLSRCILAELAADPRMRVAYLTQRENSENSVVSFGGSK